MEHLFDKLRKYAAEDVYPYHMPGHKRRPWGELPAEMYQTDITEIDGFDNLHQPEEILLELQEKASEIYGAEESFYLVNGSTCGVLCAVSSALPKGGHILMARNCHKSAYHGAYLRNLKLSYLWPPYLEGQDICDAITPEQVAKALEAEPDIEAVLIVSPTYEGRIADIGAIARIVHERRIPLIVDEAHGAHLGLAEGFARNSCQLGADLVIHSVHKTLPSLTQTALLHVSGERIDRERLRRFLHIYQSSSPSYILMASIDNALRYVEAKGQGVFCSFRKQYWDMVARLQAGCRFLSFPCTESGNPGDGKKAKEQEQTYGGARQDTGKLVISVKGTSITGKQLYTMLLKEYQLQPEMAAESYVLAMFTINDGEEAYRRMTEALLAIDGRIAKLSGFHGETFRVDARARCRAFAEGSAEGRDLCIAGGMTPREVFPLSAAWDMRTEMIKLEDSAGRCSGDFINLYPPGVPLLVPGECITEDLCHSIESALEQGLSVQGICVKEDNRHRKSMIYVRVIIS